MGLKFKAGAVLSLVLAFTATAWAQTGPQQPTGTWSSENTASFYQYGGGSTTDGTYLYTVGGYDASGPYTPQYYSAFHRYNPATNAWDSGLTYNYIRIPYPVGSTTILETGIQGNGAGYYNGYLYSFGGFFYITSGTSYVSFNAGIIRYNLSTNPGVWEWVTQPGQSTSALLLTGTRMYISGSIPLVNNRFYIAGGYPYSAGSATVGSTTVTWTAYQPTTLMTEFDPADVGTSTDPQTVMLPMTYGRYYLASAGVPALGKVYIMGGYVNAAPYYSPYNEEFSVPTTSAPYGAWATRAPFNMTNNTTYPGNYYSLALTIANRIYLIGGYNGYVSPYQYGVNLEYNPVTNIWTQRATMSTTRYMHYGAVISASEGGVTKPRAYVFGGPSVFAVDRYEAPDFGSPPNVPTAVGQTGARPETAQQALADQNQFNGWTNTQVSFTANVTDPDTTQQVRFRVQVKPQAAAWTQTSAIVNLDSGLGAQGVRTVNWTIPAGGGYDWRWRVEDSFGNSSPLAAGAWVEAFGSEFAPNTVSPDFRSDQVPPSEPMGVSPSNIDIQVPDPVFGDVTLHWIEATDNGPVAGISYELQVATEGGFQTIEAQLFSTAGTDAYPISLTVSRFEKFWRMRARDVGGNLSDWSEPLVFRVTYNDGIDHSAGDAKKACGMTAFGTPALGSALLGLMILGLASGRRRFRKV